jgi:hypothetical protein
MLIQIPVAVAELFDKVSILEIKLRHLTDPKRRQHAKSELDQLMQIVERHGLVDFLETSLYSELLDTNQALWDVCEVRRQFELAGQFDQDFVEKSRLEYKTNDLRASLKQQINERFGSTIVEVKSYQRFSHESN